MKKPFNNPNIRCFHFREIEYGQEGISVFFNGTAHVAIRYYYYNKKRKTFCRSIDWGDYDRHLDKRSISFDCVKKILGRKRLMAGLKIFNQENDW